ncbi:MAG: hypothetical protein WD356_05825 [Pseudomonadales bacterium]
MMKRICSVLTSMICAIVLTFHVNAALGKSAHAGEMVEGLWKYTKLTTSDGNEMPLTGIFLFKDGVFLQQSIFNGEPFDEQGAMAHAGPYTSEPDAIHLIAEPTVSIAPDDNGPLSYRDSTKHKLSVDRSENELTLVFGSGTVQEFERIGSGKGQVYSIEDGKLAFADNYFILVQGNENGSVSGYGTFEKQDGDAINLNVIRWAEGTTDSATNKRDVTLEADFDGRRLTLPDGRSFKVVQ